jgi:hypothetical protein
MSTANEPQSDGWESLINDCAERVDQLKKGVSDLFDSASEVAKDRPGVLLLAGAILGAAFAASLTRGKSTKDESN